MTGSAMTLLAWVTMGVICSTVWGGFLVLLVRALRFEGRRPEGEESASSESARGSASGGVS